MKVAASEIPATTGATAERAQAADGGAFRAALDAESLELRRGEKVEAVEGHGYAEIVSGRREGMFINTSGNSRHGEAFVLVRKNGVNHHIYGTGNDRKVVTVGQRPDGPETPPTAAADAPEIKLREGEKTEPVEGHRYLDIVSGKREGKYINTSGNERHGEAFVLARRHGIEYHIYGSGSDRLVVALKPGRSNDD